MTLLEVVNQAMVSIGQPPLVTWDEKPNIYRHLTGILPVALDAFASMGDWSFARKRETIIAEIVENDDDYNYRIAIPANCLRVLGTRPGLKYEIEGNYLYYFREYEEAPQEESILVLYLSRVWEEIEGDYSFLDGIRITPAIGDAMALTVAKRLALAVSADVSIINAIDTRFQEAIQQANIASIEENPGYNPQAGSAQLLEVVNEALILANQKTMNSWLVSNQITEAIKSVLPRVIGTVNSEVAWSFAKTRVVLETIEDDEFLFAGYAYRYHIPEDCMKIVQLDPRVQFEVEGNYLYTDSEEPTLVYVKRVYHIADDGNPAFVPGIRIPGKFREALSYRIAQDIATRITDSYELSRAFRDEYMAAIRSAIDENEMQSPGLLPQTQPWRAEQDRSWDE